MIETWDLFADVADITAWLDESNQDCPHEDSMRVLKLVEEAGEAAAAYIGMVGQNPRKGVTHSRNDLLGELADVALTALCAMQHFTRDDAVTRAVLAAKVQRIMTRSEIRRTFEDMTDYAAIEQGAEIDRAVEATGHLPGNEPEEHDPATCTECCNDAWSRQDEAVA